MMILGIFGGMLRALVRLVVLVAVLAQGWLYREPLMELGRTAAARWSELRRTDGRSPALASAELAAVAQAKLDDVRGGLAPRASFTAAELQSLLDFRYRSLLPAFVTSPRVTLEGDRLRLRVRVPVSRIPDAAELREIAGLLPDTTELDVRGQLLPAEDGRIAFAVDEVTAQRIPLPRRLVPMALDLLGRTAQPGLPEDAIPIRLPPGTSGAYIRSDSLVLLARAAGAG
jgi:hypothetical protein